jgi:hypothetical protein
VASLQTFPQRLAHGRRVEHRAADILIRAGWYVVPSYDFTGRDGGKAPRLTGPFRGFVLPDLDAAKDGRRLWVEVKAKTGPTFHRKTQRWEHGINRRHYYDYQQVRLKTGAPVALVIHQAKDDTWWMAYLHRLHPHRREYQGPHMGRDGMVFFPADNFACLDWVEVGP